jgi:hypothetical protein
MFVEIRRHRFIAKRDPTNSIANTHDPGALTGQTELLSDFSSEIKFMITLFAARQHYLVFVLALIMAEVVCIQSAKAETWSIVSSGTTNDIEAVTWDGNRFVAVDSEGGILESTNGNSWSRRQTTSFGFSEIVFGGGRYIAIQENDQAYFESSDRVNWSERDSGQNWIYAGSYNAGLFVLVGEYGTIIKSSNGINWSTVTTSPTDTDLDRITYGNGLYVAVGDGGIFTSPNSITWTLRDRGYIYGFSDIAYYNGRYVATSFIDSKVFTSTNGTSWTNTTIDSLNNTFPNLPPWGNAVCGGSSGFKIVCDTGKAFTSTNGSSCQSVNMQTTSDINDVAFGNEIYIAVGNNGLVRVLNPPIVQTVSVALSPLNTLEDRANNLVFTFTRSGTTANALTINFTIGGTAAFPNDYTQSGAATFTSTSGTVTFSAGSLTTMVVLDPTVDDTIELDETVVITIVSGTGYSLGSSVAAMGVINNDDSAIGNWRQTYFGSTANTGDGADLNDFDKDGINNLIEFAFGLHPKQNSSHQLPTPQKSGSNFVVTFSQPPGVSGVSYRAEWSQTLLPGSWTVITDTGISPQHTFSIPIADKSKLFMRYKISNP